MKEPSIRQRRVAEKILEILSDALTFGVSNPVLSGLTVTYVSVDRELRYADVYITSMDDEADQDEILTELRKAAGFFRSEVASQLDIRHVPEIRFKWDETMEQAQRIENILDDLDIPEDEE